MYELIKIENITVGDESVPAVNARELHEFLESKQQFSDWIKKRLEKYDFIENIDYICVSENYETQRTTGQKGISVRKEYYVTVDTAKELSMIENNEKGREARRYFIECEKGYKKTLENYIPKTLPDALEAYALELRKHEETKLLLKEAEPKIEFYNIAVASSSTVDIGEAAKILKYLLQGLTDLSSCEYKATGRNNLFKFLRREGVLMKNNAPKQEYVNRGLVERQALSVQASRV